MANKKKGNNNNKGGRNPNEGDKTTPQRGSTRRSGTGDLVALDSTGKHAVSGSDWTSAHDRAGNHPKSANPLATITKDDVQQGNVTAILKKDNASTKSGASVHFSGTVEKHTIPNEVDVGDAQENSRETQSVGDSNVQVTDGTQGHSSGVALDTSGRASGGSSDQVTTEQGESNATMESHGKISKTRSIVLEALAAFTNAKGNSLTPQEVDEIKTIRDSVTGKSFGSDHNDPFMVPSPPEASLPPVITRVTQDQPKTHIKVSTVVRDSDDTADVADDVAANDNSHRLGDPSLVADDPNASLSYSNASSGFTVPTPFRDQLKKFSKEVDKHVSHFTIEDGDAHFTDTSFQSDYHPGYLDSVMQSIRPNSKKTASHVRNVIKESIEDVAVQPHIPLKVPERYRFPKVEDAQKSVDFKFPDNYREAASQRNEEVAQLETIVKEAQARLDKMNNQGTLKRTWGRAKGLLSPAMRKQAAMAKDSELRLKEMRAMQPDEVWETVKDPNFHSVPLTQEALAKFQDISDQTKQYAHYYRELPDKEFMSMMSLLLSHEVGVDGFTMHLAAYHCGIGSNVTFSNIFGYRSVHATALKEWFKGAIARAGDLDTLIRYQWSDQTVRWCKLVWIMKEMPLATKFYLIDIKKALGDSHEDPLDGADLRWTAFTMAAKVVVETFIEQVYPRLIEWSKRDGSGAAIHPFDIGVVDKDVGLMARPTRIFSRSEPLQFPKRPPPQGKTHCHGRFVQTKLTQKPVWIEYPDQGEKDIFVLPPNVPKNAKHWELRTLPDGTRVHSMADLIAHVINFKARHNIPFLPYDPLAHAPLASLGPVIQDDQQAQGLVWDTTPESDDDITPLAYSRQPLVYRGLTPEEQKALDGHSPSENSSLTTSPGDNGPKKDEVGQSHGSVFQDSGNPLGNQVHQGPMEPLVPDMPSSMPLQPTQSLKQPAQSLKANAELIEFLKKQQMGHQSSTDTSAQKPNALFELTDAEKRAHLLAMKTPGGGMPKNMAKDAGKILPSPSPLPGPGATPDPNSGKVYPDPTFSMKPMGNGWYADGQGGFYFKKGEWGANGPNMGGNGSSPTPPPPPPPGGNDKPDKSGDGDPPFPPFDPTKLGAGSPFLGGFGTPGSMYPHASGSPPGGGPPPYGWYPYGGGGHGGDTTDESTIARLTRKRTFMMKPEIKYFPVLSSWDGYNDWSDSFKATCGGTGLHHHMDFYYDPPLDEKAYFDGLDRWLYVILDNRVKVTAGRDILRKEKGNLSGRMVMLKLWQHSVQSSEGDLSAEQRLINITGMVLDSSWNGTCLEFIDEFEKEVDTYNGLCATKLQMISEDMAITFLRRAVLGVKPLADVKARERHAIVEGRPKYTLEKYLSLLKDEAGRIDSLRTRAVERRHETMIKSGRKPSTSRVGTRPRRRINKTEMLPDIEETQEDDSGEQDPESYENLLEVFKVVMGDKPQRMDADSFEKLSPEGRKLWRQLSLPDRSTMLGSKPESTRAVNVHEVQEGTQMEHPPSEENDDDGHGTSTGTTEINNSESKAQSRSNAKSTAHPGDIRRSLSGSAAKTGGRSARAANSVEWGANRVSYFSEEDDIPANDDPYASGDSDGETSNWPAFDSSFADCWPGSSDEEDFA